MFIASFWEMKEKSSIQVSKTYPQRSKPLSVRLSFLKIIEFEKEEEKTKVVTQRVLREQDKNTLNTTMFDFQGSFGEEESNQFFA